MSAEVKSRKYEAKINLLLLLLNLFVLDNFEEIKI